MKQTSGSQSQPVGFDDSSAAVVAFVRKMNFLSPWRTNNLCEPDHARPMVFYHLAQTRLACVSRVTKDPEITTVSTYRQNKYLFFFANYTHKKPNGFDHVPHALHIPSCGRLKSTKILFGIRMLKMWMNIRNGRDPTWSTAKKNCSCSYTFGRMMKLHPQISWNHGRCTLRFNFGRGRVPKTLKHGGVGRC